MDRRATGTIIRRILAAVGLMAAMLCTTGVAAASPVFAPDDGIQIPPGVLGPQSAAKTGVLPGVVVMLRLPSAPGGTVPTFGSGAATILDNAAFGSSDSLDTYMPEQSQGRITGVTGTTIGPFTGPAGSSICSGSNTRFSEILQWARDAAAANGRPIDPNEYLMVAVQDTATCEPAGTGWVGAPGLVVYYSDWNQRDTLTVLAHEMGHNLGMDHARSHECPQGTPTGSASCTNIEYGSPFSIMGNGWADPGPNGFTALNRYQAGWLAGRTTTLTSGTSTVTLQASGGTAPGTQLLNLSSGGDLWVEYQSAVAGGIFNTPITGGVLVRSDIPSGATASADNALLKLHPEHSVANNQYALDVGERYIDPFNGMTVKVLSQDSATVQLEVGFNFGDTTPPPTPGVVGISVGSDRCAVATVTRPLDGETTTKWEWRVDAGTLATTTLASGPIQLGCPSAGTHTFTITAVDQAGNRSASASAPFTIPAAATTPAPTPDPTPDPAPGSLGDICPQVRVIRRGVQVTLIVPKVPRTAVVRRGSTAIATVPAGDARVTDQPGLGRFTYTLLLPGTSVLSAKVCKLDVVQVLGAPARVRALRVQRRRGNRLLVRWAPPTRRGAGALVYRVRQGRRVIGVTRSRAVVISTTRRRLRSVVTVQARDRSGVWGPATGARLGGTGRRR
ncbi:MAG: hypothetical protein R2878_09165 [Thermoleophilia bacterium]